MDKPKSAAEKATRSIVDTIAFTADEARTWIIPKFQRSLRINEKVRALSKHIQNDGGVLPGIITFGIIGTDRYLLDGQHRREAFLMSGVDTGYADSRVCFFSDLASMGEEFVQINSSLVRMKADDSLRGLADSIPALNYIIEQCPIVGYGPVRSGKHYHLMSMSMVLRCWIGSDGEVPLLAYIPAIQCAKKMTMESVKQLVDFLKCAHAAWGGDKEYARLYTSLNLGICMWLFRVLVLKQQSNIGQKRYTLLNAEEFIKALMALTADPHYVDWLMNRKLGDRDRSPCYTRIRSIFAKSLNFSDTGKKKLPQPSWYSGRT